MNQKKYYVSDRLVANAYGKLDVSVGCYVTLRYVSLCYATLCYVMLCNVMLRYAMLCYVIQLM